MQDLTPVFPSARPMLLSLCCYRIVSSVPSINLTHAWRSRFCRFVWWVAAGIFCFVGGGAWCVWLGRVCMHAIQPEMWWLWLLWLRRGVFERESESGVLLSWIVGAEICRIDFPETMIEWLTRPLIHLSNNIHAPHANGPSKWYLPSILASWKASPVLAYASLSGFLGTLFYTQPHPAPRPHFRKRKPPKLYY